ncbi:PQQ-binding-like beta-propeller repeat protein [Chloroflexota bacterium]
MISDFLKHKLGLGKILLLLVILVLVGGSAFGCAQLGAQPKGWSGGVITDGTLFFGSMEGQVVALNASDSGRLWDVTLEPTKSTGGFGCAPSSTAAVAIYGTPAVAGDLVYIGDYSGKIYAISASTRLFRAEELNEKDPQPIIGGAAVALGKVYVGSSDGKVYALDAVSLDTVWEFQTGDKVWSTPVIEGETLYIGSFDKKLYALSITNGRQKWEPFETGGAIVSAPLVYNNTIYFGSFDRYIYAVNTADGSLKWKSKFEASNWFWTGPVAFNNIIYAASLDGKVYALDAETGDKVTEFDLGSPVSSSPVLVDGSVIVATEEGKVYSIDTSSNQKRQLADINELAEEDLAIYSPLSADDGIVYIHAQTEKHGSLLYALNAQTGVDIWRYP